MRKKLCKTIVGLGIASLLACGCEKAANVNATTEVTKTAETTGAVESTVSVEKQNEAARKAYMDFLEDKTTVTTAEHFREDDKEYNYDYLLYGKYDYKHLKDCVSNHEPYLMLAKYELVDFGNDGVDELVLRFENQEDSCMSWTGIIKYNGNGLELNAAYEDGYRTYSSLYTNGYLEIGGSSGAGAHGFTLKQIDENGFATDVYTANVYYSTFATVIGYDLAENFEGFGEDEEQLFESGVCVYEYKDKNGVKIAVTDWDEDETIRKAEEKMINKFVELGAEMISVEEMEKLCDTTKIVGTEVAWMDWDDGTEKIATITVDYLKNYYGGDNYIEFAADKSEYSTKVLFSVDAPVKEFTVVKLIPEEIQDMGFVGFMTEELLTLPELTPEKPLAVSMVFEGSIPNMGITYLDVTGERRLFSVNMSGYDDSLYIVEEIQICE